MSNILTIEVKEATDKKIRDYLKYEHNLSSRLIKKSALDKKIKVNGEVVKLNYRVKERDIIEIDLKRDESQNIIPEKMDIDVIYEDDHIIVVNKPPFMVVHPTKSHQTGTLSNGILNHFQENNEKCIVRLVSRLDMDTSGLIIIAKNQHAHMALAKEMEHNKIDKIYLAIVHGILKEKTGTICAPIGRESIESIKRIVHNGGKEAITHYEVVEEFNNKASLVKLKLETGRTHQIRVHLSYIGHPIMGDSLYGMPDELKYINRQALHAYKLKFRHPKSKEEIVLESTLAEDMKNLIEYIKNEDAQV